MSSSGNQTGVHSGMPTGKIIIPIIGAGQQMYAKIAWDYGMWTIKDDHGTILIVDMTCILFANISVHDSHIFYK